jgi:hypothetical protein
MKGEHNKALQLTARQHASQVIFLNSARTLNVRRSRPSFGGSVESYEPHSNF